MELDSEFRPATKNGRGSRQSWQLHSFNVKHQQSRGLANVGHEVIQGDLSNPNSVAPSGRHLISNHARIRDVIKQGNAIPSAYCGPDHVNVQKTIDAYIAPKNCHIPRVSLDRPYVPGRANTPRKQERIDPMVGTALKY
jgi:hypothetical protein